MNITEIIHIADTTVPIVEPKEHIVIRASYYIPFKRAVNKGRSDRCLGGNQKWIRRDPFLQEWEEIGLYTNHSSMIQNEKSAN